MTGGIYTITSPAGDMYVGSSKSIETRWTQHRFQLKKGVHHNRLLQDVANKHGVRSLQFEIVDTCDERDLLAREQEILDRLKPNCNLYQIVGTNLAEKDYVKTAFRCPPDLYAHIVTDALEARMSINSHIVNLLQKAMDNGGLRRVRTATLSEKSLDQISELIRRVLAESEEDS